MKLVGHSCWVFSVSFSPDGSRIVSGSDDKTVRVWDSHTGAELMKLEGHAGGVRSVDWHGDKIVSGSDDWTVRVWDVSVINEWDSLVRDIRALKITVKQLPLMLRLTRMNYFEKALKGFKDKAEGKFKYNEQLFDDLLGWCETGNTGGNPETEQPETPYAGGKKQRSVRLRF